MKKLSRILLLKIVNPIEISSLPKYNDYKESEEESEDNYERIKAVIIIAKNIDSKGMQEQLKSEIE